MTVTKDAGSVLSAVRRAGLLDPLSVAALTTATAWWGPSVTAGYGAAAVRHPNRIAIIDDFGVLTYRSLDRRAARLAAALRRHGLARDNAVGIMCRNHRGFVEANLAAAKLGARPILINPSLPSPQLVEVIDGEAITVLIADREIAGAAEADPEVRVVECAPELDPDWSFPGLPRRLPLLQLPRPFDVTTPVILTSGTTGAPKGTRRSTDPRAALSALGFLEAMPYTNGEVMVLPAPLFHAWGFSQLMLTATMAGTVVLRRRFDPACVLADLEAHVATSLVAVPVMLQRILDHEAANEQAAAERDLSELRLVAVSGSALPGDLATRWMDHFGDNLHNLYGSTEAGQVSVATPANLRAAPETAGVPLRGVTVRIVDGDGGEVPTGAAGEIMIESAARFDGYTDGGTKPMVGRLMSTGDRGHLDEDGRLFVQGRADDMIISGGENIFPTNIERSLLGHDAVAEASVVGVDDAELGQKVRAVIVPEAADRARSARALTTAIKAALKTELAGHEVPREFVYVSALPRNATGKILRTELTGPKRSIPHQPET